MDFVMKISFLKFPFARACLFALLSASAAYSELPFTFTDDLNRSVTVFSARNTAVLQGSLCSIWLLAGGSVKSATSDCFFEPPEMSKAQADEMNRQWQTDAFYERQAGFINQARSFQAEQNAAVNIGAMMSPNAELILACGTDFAILSANIAAHKKLLPLLEAAKVPCAFFDIETFDDYLNMLSICCAITERSDLLLTNGLEIKERIVKITSEAEKSALKKSVLLLRSSAANVSAKSSQNNMTGAMLKDLGAINIADSNQTSKSTASADLSIEKIASLDPDFVFITLMGADEAKAIGGFKRKLESNPLWQELSAVKNARVYVLPKELFHYKPTSRWDKSYEILFSILSQ